MFVGWMLLWFYFRIRVAYFGCLLVFAMRLVCMLVVLIADLFPVDAGGGFRGVFGFCWALILWLLRGF